MNIPFAAAALLLSVAFFAHLFVGTRETLSLKPDAENSTQQSTRNWMQAVCAFQLVSVDLLLLAATACLLAFTRVFDGMEAAAARFVAAYLGLWYAAWLNGRCARQNLFPARPMDIVFTVRLADAVGCVLKKPRLPR